MKLKLIKQILNADVITGQSDKELENVDVMTACGSDLMSDVLAFVKDQGLLLTGLVNPQVIRTAEMMDICAICFVRGKKPDDSTINLAKSRHMILLTTDYPLYIASGKLYSNGLMPKED